MANLVRVSVENGLWKNLILAWEDQCQQFDEDLGEYAPASLPVLEQLASETQRKNAGVYALEDNGEYLAICQLNVTPLPGYIGPVLRTRHIIHAPKYDFDESLEVDDYVKALGGVLVGAFTVSSVEMPAKHIKFHFKSPAERMFIEALRKELHDLSIFEKIDLQGSWLYITKKAGAA